MSQERDFKLHFASMLQNVQQKASKDNETMLLLGSLASDLAGNLKTSTWTAAKSAMQGKDFEVLLHTFEQQGKEHILAGRTKHGYVIQILAASLIARTQRADPQMEAGEALLDQIIDYTLAVYRKNRKAAAN